MTDTQILILMLVPVGLFCMGFDLFTKWYDRRPR